MIMPIFHECSGSMSEYLPLYIQETLNSTTSPLLLTFPLCHVVCNFAMKLLAKYNDNEKREGLQKDGDELHLGYIYARLHCLLAMCRSMSTKGFGQG